MDKRIIITVFGAPGSGKTTIAREFELFLKSRGFTDVTMRDHDREMGCDYPELQEQRMEALAPVLNVEIVAVSLSRKPVSTTGG
jgi:uridine kinase